MDGDSLLATVRADHETALSRLGSSKSLYAWTGGDLEPERVHGAAADHLAAIEGVLAAWSGALPAPADETVGELAATLAEHASRLAPADRDPGGRRAADEALAEPTAPGERLGALLGRLLVLERTLGQSVGFFVGDADPGTADDYRSVVADVEDGREAALEALVALEVDEDAVADAAGAVVQAAYDDYVETLEGMGIEPKDVC